MVQAQGNSKATSAEAFPAPTVDVVLLGTFHFRDAGLDDYKPQHVVDISSPERQKQVEEVVNRLASFAPNKIALEVRASEAVGS